MHRMLATLVSLAWGLWFGGMIMLFVAVTSLFVTFAADRAVAGGAASGIFGRFEVFQLALAGAALIATFAWRLMAPAGVKTALFTLFAVATLGAVFSTAWITPQIEGLRMRGRSESAEFKKLHGLSMATYTAQAAVLLVAGLVLPAAIRSDDRVARAGASMARGVGDEPADNGFAARGRQNEAGVPVGNARVHSSS